MHANDLLRWHLKHGFNGKLCRDQSIMFAMDIGGLSEEDVGMYDTYLAFKICTLLFSIKQKFKF